ncbi:MAG TPA: NADH-quinone oxidoreductase subunit C [Ilumatobacteraceae bacterium]|nr:NADH-quinone oxidoreductase subunit C [Ilumatobacteraceae bacterium]
MNGPQDRTRRAVDVAPSDLRANFLELIESGHRLALVAAHHDRPDGGSESMRVVYLLVAGPPDTRVELHLRLPIDRPELPSLADVSFPAGRFEREMHDLFGITPVGHHQPARLVLHQHWPQGWHPMRHDAGPPPPFDDETESYPFLSVEGPGVYEIPVGPVHAGVIEPGHFRFSVVGETILNMKARLWFVHKGIERLFQGRTLDAGVELAERISGDTAVGHNLAYCLAIEEAVECSPPPEAQALRALLLELERLYNHVTDIGAMGNDVAFGIAHAHTMRLREQLLRINARITGHRLLRGGVVPGGTRADWLPDASAIAAIRDDIHEVVEIMLANTTLVDRFTGTSMLSNDDAAQIGTLGYVARASSMDIDARRDHPFAEVYRNLTVPVLTSGDVMSRFQIRVAEIDSSTMIINELLGVLQPGVYRSPIVARGQVGSGTGLVEGWRGTIAHRVEVGGDGSLSRVKIVDPSFFNWPALPVALAGDTIVPDFPLTNKSFNLSYAGNDL